MDIVIFNTQKNRKKVPSWGFETFSWEIVPWIMADGQPTPKSVVCSLHTAGLHDVGS